MTPSISRTALTLAEVASLPSQSAGEGAFGVKPGGTPIFRYGSNAEVALLTAAQPRIPQARLSLVAGTPVPTANVTGATTLYLTPYQGNVVGVPDGSGGWVYFILTADVSLAIPAVANALYDIFAYNNAGALVLEATQWTNYTTRATALTNTASGYRGWALRSDALTRLFLGTLGTTGVAGQSEFSDTKRLLWNNFNRVRMPLERVDTTDSWVYSTATWRQFGGNAANQIEYVQGLSEDSINLHFEASMIPSSVAGVVGINLDATSGTPSVRGGLVYGTSIGGVSMAMFERQTAAGRHYLALMEYANSGNVTVYGDGGVTWTESRASGSVMA